MSECKKRTVDAEVVVADDLLDHSPLLEISQSLAGQATVDLETVDKGGDGDETVGLDILVELLSGRLLKDDGVLGLVLNYTAKPMSASFCATVSLSPVCSPRVSPQTRKSEIKYISIILDEETSQDR